SASFVESVSLSSTSLTDLWSPPCGFSLWPSSGASTYRRSVLDARGNLRGDRSQCKWIVNEKARVLRPFFRERNQHVVNQQWITLWRGKSPRKGRRPYWTTKKPSPSAFVHRAH